MPRPITFKLTVKLIIYENKTQNTISFKYFNYNILLHGKQEELFTI